MTAQESERMKSGFRARLESEFAAADGYRPNKADWLDGRWSGMGVAEDDARRGETGVDLERLKIIGRRITSIPPDFTSTRLSAACSTAVARWSRRARASTGRWASTWRSARC